MKKVFLKGCFKLLKLTNGRPFTTFYSGSVQILMFHRIVSSFGEKRICNQGIEITEGYLEYLIAFYLKNGVTPISINELEKTLFNPGKKRYVVFTFDDGYYDNYQKALPIFEKFRVPFAVYIPIDFINRKQFAWWYFIEDIIRDNTEIVFSEDGVSETKVTIKSLKQKEEFFIQLRTGIQKSPSILEFLIKIHNPDISKYHNLFLNLEQLRRFSEHPLVTIGSHSLSHPSLAKVSDQQSLEEIHNSKIELEKMIGKKVQHFSYPFGTRGDVSIREIENVKKAGYLTALTTSYGDVFEKDNLFSLPRIWTSEENKENDLLKSIYGINNLRFNK